MALAATACSSGTTPAAAPTTTPTTAAPTPPGARPSAGCSAAPRAPGTARLSVSVAGRARSYLLTTPAGATRTRPAPLVLLFHGFSGSGRQISDLTGLPARAGRLGMFAAAPDGTGGTWSTPDPPFIDVLLRSLTRTRCVDLTRIYLTGFSAGAAFSISYACRHQNEIAAIAPVAVDLPLGCAGPTSILVFHGTADPLVAYAAGGQGASLPGLKLPGTMADMDAWAKLGRCRDSPTTVRLGTQVVRKTWPGCADGVEVGLYRIDGGGHTWPGADPKRGLGLTTTQVSATDQILAFFARHRLAG